MISTPYCHTCGKTTGNEMVDSAVYHALCENILGPKDDAFSRTPDSEILQKLLGTVKHWHTLSIAGLKGKFAQIKANVSKCLKTLREYNSEITEKVVNDLLDAMESALEKVVGNNPAKTTATATTE